MRRQETVRGGDLCQSVNKTFQMLVWIPVGKFVTDPVDEIEQDFGGLDQVFHTVPISNWCVSTSIGSHINLQKPDQQSR